MTALEWRCRWLLRAYPAWYRRQRGEEMLGTLMEASPAGRRWPSLRDIRAMLIGGLRVRAGQHRRLSTPANLRLAGLLGVALALLWLIGNNLGSDIMFWAHVYPAATPAGLGYQAAASLLALAAVLAAWFAPWPVVAAPALAGAALLGLLGRPGDGQPARPAGPAGHPDRGPGAHAAVLAGPGRPAVRLHPAGAIHRGPQPVLPVHPADLRTLGGARRRHPVDRGGRPPRRGHGHLPGVELPDLHADRLRRIRRRAGWPRGSGTCPRRA